MVNKVILIGRIGKDPDIKTFDNGGKMAKFSLATTEKWKDKTSGETKERTEWHNIVVNGKLADIVERFVQKGSQISITGEIRYRDWDDKEGIKHYVTEIHAQSMELLGEKPKEQKETTEAGEVFPPKTVTVNEQKNDDLPFD